MSIAEVVKTFVCWYSCFPWNLTWHPKISLPKGKACLPTIHFQELLLFNFRGIEELVGADPQRYMLGEYDVTGKMNPEMVAMVRSPEMIWCFFFNFSRRRKSLEFFWSSWCWILFYRVGFQFWYTSLQFYLFFGGHWQPEPVPNTNRLATEPAIV